MGYEVKILADSLAPSRKRLTTFECTYPRFVHSELLTHRAFSRNSASSRAIPIQKMIDQVKNDPVMPVWWGKNQAGMQAREELSGEERFYAQLDWLNARSRAVESAEMLSSWGLHKQIVNRLLEPWMWITTLISATDWNNFWHLRTHEDAQPEIKHLADLMWQSYGANHPVEKRAGEWHLPLVFEADYKEVANGRYNESDLCRISVGRCARVSYLTHEGKREPIKDMKLHDQLAKNGHWSPFEHVAAASALRIPSGNFTGWYQYRKSFIGENWTEAP